MIDNKNSHSHENQETDYENLENLDGKVEDTKATDEKILVITQDSELFNNINKHFSNKKQFSESRFNESTQLTLEHHKEAYNLSEKLNRGKYAAIILCINPSRPGLNKYDYLSFSRQSTKIPLIVIDDSSTFSSSRECELLMMGADAVITKPVNFDLLFLRTYILISLSSHKIPNLVIKDELVCNFNERKVYIKGRLVPLSATEFNIFVPLAKSPNCRVEKSKLLNLIQNPGGGYKLIDVYLCKIRNKFREAGATYEFIQTIWKTGPVLITDPEPISENVSRKMEVSSLKNAPSRSTRTKGPKLKSQIQEETQTPTSTAI